MKNISLREERMQRCIEVVEEEKYLCPPELIVRTKTEDHGRATVREMEA